MRLSLASFVLIVTLLFVSGCGGSSGSSGGVIVNVSMTGMAYVQQAVQAHPGDTIRWTNNEALLHTVTSDTSQAGLSSAGQYPGGMNQNNTFNWVVPANATVGTVYFYHCAFHGVAGNGSALGTGMAGQITVN